MKIVAFDGDHTLWLPLSGVHLSDKTPDDATGYPDFSYAPLPDDPSTVRRDDGALFRLREDALEVILELQRREILVGVVSYNHESNVRSILEAFGLHGIIDYVVAEWHTNKDRMLEKLRAEALSDGYDVEMSQILLVDDDPESIYRGQCARLGACFLCFGRDVNDLRSVMDLVDRGLKPEPAQ